MAPWSWFETHLSTVSFLTSASTADAGESLCFHTNLSLEIENDFIKHADVYRLGNLITDGLKRPHSRASRLPPFRKFLAVQADF